MLFIRREYTCTPNKYSKSQVYKVSCFRGGLREHFAGLIMLEHTMPVLKLSSESP